MTLPVHPSKDVEMEPPKPLSEDDVLAVMKRLSNLDGNMVNEICNTYAKEIKRLVNTVERSLKEEKDDNEDELVEIDRLRRIISLCPTDELFIRSKDKIWYTRYQIVNKNSDWFLNRDYGSQIKKDHKKAMIETLIRLAQGRFNSLSAEEQDVYWDSAFKLLNIVSKYKKLTGEL